MKNESLESQLSQALKKIENGLIREKHLKKHMDALIADSKQAKDLLREGCQELKYLENFFCNDHLDAVKAREFLIKADLFLKPLTTVKSEGEMMESDKTCEVVEKFGKEFFDCGLEAVAKCESGAEYYVCAEHAIFAMVAGWQPKQLQVNKE